MLDYGLSFSIPSKKSETFKQPPKGRPIVLSIFVKNPQDIDKLQSVKLIDDDNNDKSEPIELEKINENLYVTEPITFPAGKFKIVVDALDDNKQNLVLVSPPTFQAIDTSKLAFFILTKLDFETHVAGYYSCAFVSYCAKMMLTTSRNGCLLLTK